MMTARAEYRLSLRADNATSRLGEAALAAGCVSRRRRRQIEDHFARVRAPAGPRPRKVAPIRSTRPMSSGRSANGKSFSATLACGSRQKWTMPEFPGLSNEMVERLAGRTRNAGPGLARAGGDARCAVGALRGGEPPGGRVIDVWSRSPGGLFHVKHSKSCERYVALLREEKRRQNLVSAATLDGMWDRHILDSAQLVRFEPARAHRGSTSARARAFPESSSPAWWKGRSRWSSRGGCGRTFSTRRANRSVSPPPCFAQGRARRGELRRDHRASRRPACAIFSRYPHICPQEKPFGRFRRAAVRRANWPKRGGRGKVASTWNKVSPTRTALSSSGQG